MNVRRFLTLAAGTAVLSMLLGIAASPVSAATGTVRYVDDDGHAGGAQGCAGAGMAFEEIQLAIDASAAHDTVRVCPGNYRENLNITGKTGLLLEGVKPWAATLRPPVLVTSTAGFDPAILTVLSNGVTVRWLNFIVPATGACDYSQNAIIVDGAHHVAIRGNHFSGGRHGDPTSCGLEDAVIFTNGSTGRVAYNLIRRFIDTGIFIGNGSDVKVYRNSIRFFAPIVCSAARPACAASIRPAGIEVRGIEVSDATAKVARNRLKEDPSTGSSVAVATAIQINGGGVVTVIRNRIRGAFDGIDAIQGEGSIVSNDIRGGIGTGIDLFLTNGMDVRGNLVTGQGGAGMNVSSDSANNTIHDNDFSGNIGTDCVDQSSGPANTWTNDFGDDANPSTICTPKP